MLRKSLSLLGIALMLSSSGMLAQSTTSAPVPAAPREPSHLPKAPKHKQQLKKHKKTAKKPVTTPATPAAPPKQ
jgi:hypothetical protein